MDSKNTKKENAKIGLASTYEPFVTPSFCNICEYKNENMYRAPEDQNCANITHFVGEHMLGTSKLQIGVLHTWVELNKLSFDYIEIQKIWKDLVTNEDMKKLLDDYICWRKKNTLPCRYGKFEIEI